LAGLRYASSADWGVHFGLGSAAVVNKIEIIWPSGIRQVLTNVKADRILDVTEEWFLSFPRQDLDLPNQSRLRPREFYFVRRNSKEGSQYG
jgi:hypothetical protein